MCVLILFMYSVKRSFGDDQRLSTRKNNGQGKKTRTNEQFIKDSKKNDNEQLYVSSDVTTILILFFIFCDTLFEYHSFTSYYCVKYVGRFEILSMHMHHCQLIESFIEHVLVLFT